MDRLLVSDLSATTEIDPELGRLEFDLELYSSYSKREDVAEKIADLQKRIEEYKASEDPKPVFTIGYIPPAKHTEIKAHFVTVSGIDGYEPIKVESAELQRKVCAWGLRGWNIHQEKDGKVIPFDMKFKADKCRSRDYQIVDDSCIDVVEHNGWLESTARKILEYNRLSEEHKKK